jgi:signal transduction histidine kinase
VQLSVTQRGSTLIVRDSGVGIPTEMLPHVFERFVQADAKTATWTRGLGLGLAITKHVIEAHGGRVQAHSDGENRGTAVTITLPLIAEPASADVL